MVSLKEPRILILGDEPVIARELQETLKGLGYDVIGPAHSCEAALELLWSNDVDAAILDVVLGEGTCEVVADELTLSGIPWAFSSGYDRHELQDRFPDAPVIAKPSASERVADALNLLFDGPKG